MARVDPHNDAIKRYVVLLYAYDPARRERRHQEVAAFDDELEALRCFGETHAELVERRQAGDADSREHVSMVPKEPGDQAHSQLRRLERKRFLRKLQSPR